jgi:GAF domain-containing protein
MTMNILRLSTDLQSEIIKNLATQADLTKQADYLMKMLDSIVAKASEVLKADACSIYLIDDHLTDHRGERQATMRAAKGYQEIAVDTAICRVLPAEEIPNYAKLGLTSWVISTGRSFLAESPDKLVQHPYWSGEYDKIQLPEAMLKPAAFLAVPLRSPQGQIIGALKAERLPTGSTSVVGEQVVLETPARSHTFTVNDQIALETLARVAGRCITYIDNALSGQLDAAIIAWALDVIAEAVVAEGELDAFLDIVARATAAATTADSCAVFLIDESKATLTQRAGCGSQVLRKVIRSYRLPDSTQLVNCENPRICTPAECAYRANLPHVERVGVTAWVAATGKSFHARNFEELRKHCHHRGKYDKPNFEGAQQCGAWLGVPLVVGGTIIGVLKIENISTVGISDERDFTPGIQQRLDVLAQDIALAIQRLQSQSPARYEGFKNAMPTILEILRGELDVRKLVEKVVEETAKLFDARSCALFLKEGNQLIQPPWAAYGWAQRGPKVRKYELVNLEHIVDNPTTKEQKVGLTVWIAVKKQRFTAKSNLELTSHLHHKGTFDEHNFNEEERCESFMGIPLLFGKEEELVGVLKVETKQRNTEAGKEVAYFSEQDELVFELIAKSAAIAIQNARLLESRRLTDQLVKLPHLDGVMSALHEFIRGRVEVVSTLESTAEVVGGKDQDRASVIQNFASLLEPHFSITILEQLAGQMRGPLDELLRFFVACIRAENLGEIRALPAQRPHVAGLLRTDFFLHECARILFDTLDKANAQLEQYEQDRTQRAKLQDCLKLLTKQHDAIEEMDLFEKSVLGRIFQHWQAVIAYAAGIYIDIVSPYVAGLPLNADSRVFVGREEIFNWIQNNLYTPTQKNVLVLHGVWHAGKTSILRQLEAGPLGRDLRERERNPIFPIFVDLQAAQDRGIEQFLLRLALLAAYALRARGVNCPLPSAKDFQVGAYWAFEQFLMEVNGLLTARANGLLVFMLDEFERLSGYVRSGRMEAGIFDYLRSIMQHQRAVTFILAGHYRLEEMVHEYSDRVFDVALHKEVGFLQEDAARRLIGEPVKAFGVTYADEVISRILKLSGGHPYFIQQLCHNCINILNQLRTGYDVTSTHLHQALEEALETGSDLTLQNLWRDTNKDGQQILGLLARLATDERPGVAASELLRQSEQIGMSMDDISRSLEKLEAQQLIVRERSAEREQDICRYNVDLLRIWVMRRLGQTQVKYGVG